VGPDRFYLDEDSHDDDQPPGDAANYLDYGGEFDTETGRRGAEPPAAKDDTDDLDSKEPVPEINEDRELSLSSVEILGQSTLGAAVGLGVVQPRQLASLTTHFNFRPGFYLLQGVGAGAWEMDGEEGSKRYRVSGTAKGVNFGGRYFFTSIAAFYADAALSYLFWQGDVKPVGTDESATSAVVDKLNSGFSASGPVLSSRFGWMRVWENGFFIDYCIFGAAKPLLVSTTYTRSSAETKAAVRRELEKPMIWGLVNISFGLFF